MVVGLLSLIGIFGFSMIEEQIDLRFIFNRQVDNVIIKKGSKVVGFSPVFDGGRSCFLNLHIFLYIFILICIFVVLELLCVREKVFTLYFLTKEI